MKPLISIVVPVYNVEKYIHECLESILNQSYKNIEVIIVNDGTLDNSIAKIEDLLKDKRTRLISQVNQGLSAARNTGIKAALGEYISFIDSDDKVKSSFIETLYDKANETNADIVRGSFRNFDGNIPEGWITDFNISPSRGTEALRYFLNDNVSFVVWSSLYRTTFLRENRLEFTEGILLEDGDFTTRSYINASVVATSDAPNYYYRVRPGSILTSNNAQRRSQSEAKVIQNFINWHESITNHEIKLLIEQSIYAFMRDWTKVLVKNKVKFSAHNSCYVAAKTITEDVLKSRTLFERLKFNAKLFIIECKYR